MVIVGFIGELGTGKTLSMTWFAENKFHKHKIPVYANYGFKHRKQFLKKPDDMKNLKNGCIALDEVWLWLDSRAFMKKQNKFLSGILLKSRRRGLDILYTAQDFSQVEKRLRNITDILVYPEMSPKMTTCYAKAYSRFSGKQLYTVQIKTKPVFKLYSHTEELDYLEDADD
jgi:hypothetical protein